MSDYRGNDELSDGSVKSVLYSIVFVKRGVERVLVKNRSAVVSGSISKEVFAAWMLSRYFQSDPPPPPIPEADRQYLQVNYTVTVRGEGQPREAEKRQTAAVAGIRRAIVERSKKRKESAAVLRLPLDKIVDEKVLDVTGQAYPVLGDPKAVPNERFGSAVAFDGKDDLVDCGNLPKFSITGDLTLEAWVCPAGDMHGITLLTKHFDGEYDLTFWKQRLAYYHGPDWHRNYHFFEPTFTAGQWRHVAVVRRADAKVVSFYLDGEKSGDDYTYNDPPPATQNRLGVGYRLNTGANAFDGLMADVRIYNRALDQSEIRKDKENPRS